jgi:excisionase family DNA binding protein
MSDTYYSIKEVAALVRVSYLTVYRWIRAEKLKSYRVGKQYRIKKSDLNKFMNTQK